jgi:glucose/arabinose dehydrogenase
VPWNVLQPGYKVEKVASGFQLPVNIVFIPNPGNQPNDPFFYVTELYGTIKVVRRNGVVSNYATNLLNFNPTGNFPGSGEQGLAGIVVEPNSGDLIAGMLYDSGGPHYPKIVRFHSNDGGLTAATQTTIKQFPGEEQGQSHFISNISIGPDGKLYIHMGDGFTASTALNMNSYRGKILRMNLDGSAPSDNPFYNSSSITAQDFIYAYGLRNPFGGVWRAADGFLYEVENGPGANDRLAKITRGTSYGWNNNESSMTINAKHVWTNTVGPVNIAFIQSQTFAGSGFPISKFDHAFVTESGPTYATGPQTRGKRITEFVFNQSGDKISGPATFVEYTGSGKATAVGLAAGPDGLYFTDLYKDLNSSGPTEAGANILRIKYIGIADFTADIINGEAPLEVQFSDQSNVPNASSWLWSFGDGTTSNQQNPVHTFTQNGAYNIRLSITGSNGTANKQKNAYIVVGNVPGGLRSDYYDDLNFTGNLITRIDSTINFNWNNGSPDPSMGADNFTVRWTGGIQTGFSETYTFYTYTDDGVRLWIDDQLLIDKWIDQSPREWSGQKLLTAGQRYNIKMEFYERGGGAVATLSWQSASQPKQIIPKNFLYYSSSTLPVELISFTGKVKNENSVFLSWETASEINNFGFDVERKMGFAEKWEKIGFVNGNGNSSIKKEYSFVDLSLPSAGKYFYRLKQIDTDGTFEFSDVIEFDILHKLDYELSQNFPNPFNPVTLIKYTLPEEKLVTLKVFSALGEEVATLVNEEKTAGFHEIKFDAGLAGIASGVYFYELKAGDFHSIKKFVLLK